MEVADFSGYATKAGLKCSDGRTIMPEAFKAQDGMTVPLVWQHGHNSPENVLGHAVLEAREDGVYTRAFFNDTPAGQTGKKLVEHKDIKHLSIYANQLVEKSKRVFDGVIKEVSLVLSGANPGALIDFVNVQHSDGDIITLDDEAVIYTGLEIDRESKATGTVEHAEDDTIGEIYEAMSDEQKNVVHYMLAAALEGKAPKVEHSETTPVVEEKKPVEENLEEEPKEGDDSLAHQEGSNVVTKNIFEKNGDVNKQGERHTLSHSDMRGIFENAKKAGSLKTAIEDYALSHGIENIDVLFPDAKAIADRPEFDKRRTEWVAGVLNGTRHTPFSRIKSLSADLTLEDARAKGYVKGNLKKEEFFAVSKRVTTPTTVYKKQKLDRDDIIDITDFDVVAWLRFEMRLMLDEELARAVLIGDGRDVEDPDKISETNIRPIATDDDLYAATINVNLDDANSTWIEFLEAIIESRRFYKGSGQPDFYTTELVISKLLLLRDGEDRRFFRTLDDLAAELRVGRVIPVEAMESQPDLLGIMVNLSDYTIGADRGGDVTMFDDFDIDYNQYKYLIETRCSGALTKIRSALVYRKVAGGAALVVPAAPTQDDNDITIVTTTGATYKIGAFTGDVTYNSSPVTVGQTVTVSHDIVLGGAGAKVTIEAVPASGSYYFGNNVEDEWTFKYPV